VFDEREGKREEKGERRFEKGDNQGINRR